MAHIPELSDDLEIISKLGDTPNTDNGLTSDELKAKFDLAATLIKAYINEHIVPTINSYVASNDGFLKRIGGTMEGILNMGNNRISDVSDPKDEGDAVNKRSALLKSGGTMAGQLSMGGNRLTDLAAPEGAGDGVNKGYVEDYVNDKRKTFQAVILASGWSATPPYTNTVSIIGVQEADMPHIAAVITTAQIREAWCFVAGGTAKKDAIEFTALEDKPTVDIPIQVEVLR